MPISDLTDAHSPSAALLAKMESVRRRLEGKTRRQQELAAKHRQEAKSMERLLRALETDMEIISGTREISVSLLHKEVAGTAYIKGRTWWDGKQREVQVGSISAVLGRLNALPSAAGSKLPTWKQLRRNSKLIGRIKELGRDKLRSYIEQRLIHQHMGETFASGQPDPVAIAQGEIALQTVPAADESGNWYASWRMDNILEQI